MDKISPNDDSGIPLKRYFTIGEVSQLSEVKPHVLRYWEQEFHQLKPSKRRGNRRYYQYKDVLLVKEIRRLLYEQGYTIAGARQKLDANEFDKTTSSNLQSFIKQTIKDLEQVVKHLES